MLQPGIDRGRFPRRGRGRVSSPGPGRGRGAIGDVHTTTPAPVTRRVRGRGYRANHGKTKYLRVDGNHANHKNRSINGSVVARIKIVPFRDRAMFRRSRDMT